MRWRLTGMLLLGCMLNFFQGSFADEVHLKSGKVVRGDILEENEKIIKGRFDGVDMIFRRDEIVSVNKTNDQTKLKLEESSTDKDISRATSWWKYAEMDEGERRETTVKLFYRGTEDVIVSGISHEGCSKDVVVSEEANQDGSREVEECTVWSIEGVGLVKEDCITQAYDPDGKLEESDASIRKKKLVSAQIKGKIFNADNKAG